MRKSEFLLVLEACHSNGITTDVENKNRFRAKGVEKLYPMRMVVVGAVPSALSILAAKQTRTYNSRDVPFRHGA